MKTWYVTVRAQETIEVEAETEEQATLYATSRFDPYAIDHEIVEVYSEEIDQ
jgi:hypothetical protein